MFSALFLRISEGCSRSLIAARLCQKTRRRAADSTSSTARRANAVFWQRKPLSLDVAKDKTVSRRQTTQYGKARSTQQRRILTKEGAIFRGGALKPFIYKGSRGDCLETPYPQGVAGILFCVFDYEEAPRTPLGAAAGAGQLGGNKGLIV